MFYPVLVKQVKYFKETEGGQEIVSQVLEELAKKWAEEEAEERVLEEKKASARRMIVRRKLTLEEIAEDTDLPIEVVRNLVDLQLA